MAKSENQQGVDIGRVAKGVDFDDPKSIGGYLALVNHQGGPLPRGSAQSFDTVSRHPEHSQSFDANEKKPMQDGIEYSIS